MNQYELIRGETLLSMLEKCFNFEAFLLNVKMSEINGLELAKGYC